MKIQKTPILMIDVGQKPLYWQSRKYDIKNWRDENNDKKWKRKKKKRKRNKWRKTIPLAKAKNKCQRQKIHLKSATKDFSFLKDERTQCQDQKR